MYNKDITLYVITKSALVLIYSSLCNIHDKLPLFLYLMIILSFT